MSKIFLRGNTLTRFVRFLKSRKIKAITCRMIKNVIDPSQSLYRGAFLNKKFAVIFAFFNLVWMV